MFGKKFNINMLIAILLGLNILLIIYVAFFKRDALRMETLKAGGSENMTLVKQLYRSDAYNQQQKSAIEQVLGSINGATTQAATQ